MTIYGLYLRDPDAGDLVWFTSGRDLAPGAYVRGRGDGSAPDVHVAESIPALILAVGPLIEQAELRGQADLAPSDAPPGADARTAQRMTESLLQSLTETSDIWVVEPDWLDELRPVP